MATDLAQVPLARSRAQTSTAAVTSISGAGFGVLAPSTSREETLEEHDDEGEDRYGEIDVHPGTWNFLRPSRSLYYECGDTRSELECVAVRLVSAVRFVSQDKARLHMVFSFDQPPELLITELLENVGRRLSLSRCSQ